MANRGEFTGYIEHKMKSFLGRDTSRTELRLYPYLIDVMMNDQKIDPNKINGEERKILQLLRESGHIEGGAGGLAITKEFYDFITDIVFDSYVAHEDMPS